MSQLALIALLVSAGIGILHGLYVLHAQVADSPRRRPVSSMIRGFYYGLWTLALWLLLGTYALLFWLVSIVVYTTDRAIHWIAPPRAQQRRSTHRLPGGQ